MSSTDIFSLKGRVALVTGASSGLGRAAATFLAQAGAQVVGLARRADALDQWRQEAGGETAALAADLASDADLDGLASRASEPFGPPDILVNAAGLNLRQSADDVTRDGWERTIALNLTVPFFLAQALVPAMREKRWGRIINFASLQSRRAFTNGIAYGASKGGVEQMTRAMAGLVARRHQCQCLGAGLLPHGTDRPRLRRSRGLGQACGCHLHRPQWRDGRYRGAAAVPRLRRLGLCYRPGAVR